MLELFRHKFGRNQKLRQLKNRDFPFLPQKYPRVRGVVVPPVCHLQGIHWKIWNISQPGLIMGKAVQMKQGLVSTQTLRQESPCVGWINPTPFSLYLEHHRNGIIWLERGQAHCGVNEFLSRFFFSEALCSEKATEHKINRAGLQNSQGRSQGEVVRGKSSWLLSPCVS